jgi:hypothetical protein
MMNNSLKQLESAIRLYESQYDQLTREIDVLDSERHHLEKAAEDNRLQLASRSRELAANGCTGTGTSSFSVTARASAHLDARLCTGIIGLEREISQRQQKLFELKRRIRTIEIMQERRERQRQYEENRRIEADAAYLYLIRQPQTNTGA